MSSFSSGMEKTGQILFRDNGNIRFRQIEVSEASLLEKNNGIVLKGWRHLFKLQFPFEGYGQIHAGMFTLAHERDIIWDLFGILSDKEKPEASDLGKGLFNRRGIKEVAQSKCYKHEHQKPPSTMVDKITWVLIVLVILFGIAIFKAWMS